jgi:hypothetical protein
VRYYGCEALYKISQVALSAFVDHFNGIFDGLYNLSALMLNNRRTIDT